MEPIKRSGARAGDNLFVTGALGGSLLGRHMTFTPRVALARELATKHKITAMLDISDGLSRDLRHICSRSRVGVTLEARLIPIHDDAKRLAQTSQLSPLEHALHDGEDHELLFTSPESEIPGATRIGTITAEAGLWIVENGQRRLLEAKGWEHRL